ncbi:MAG: glutamyl-tRNA reductase [Acidimicrobiaceae bacterium]|nr:glutamyl-tRNA reductase [Acidimicrobiaceae bacterium]MYK77492.1 glutamyl-tRNA reductase [Acidimicrobiaceae bacterium]
MSLVVVGCNHRATPLGLLERMTVAPDDLPKALHDLAVAEHLSESVLLSTCNRIEVYAYAERFHGGYADIRELIARHSGLPPEIVGDELYSHHDADAVRHLFAVATGLDSVVVGEHEVLGQVRDAWQAARSEGTVGAVLEPLFRRAVETGKRARTETGIARGIASLSHAAVALAAERLGGLTGRRVLVLGAGEVAAGTLKSLADAHPGDIAVASRSPERAVAAAQLCGGRAVALAELDTALASADVAITTTGATEIVLEHSDIDAVMTRRAGAELLIVDVAVPRDVDPAARELPGVTLLDMDDLGDFVERERSGRTQETDSVQAIIDEEVEFYLAEASAREVAPLIAALRGRAELLSASELERHASRLADLSPAQRAAVESLLRGVVNKLLHEPTVRLKDAAGHARGDRLAEALRDLFDL